ncbi:unnamed protein product [Porites lobata]|uniref:Uncharacterized protein n=1 Tax=Porites lobata TaxID=104759 RepID=A0ABN8QZZ4_9CNID|nr:unnamed protein product [Porites lobata]
MTQWLGQSALILTRSLIWKKSKKGKLLSPSSIMMSSFISLASLQDVSLEQLVEVKAKLTRLTAVKTQNNRFGQPLQKQEAILVDHTTSIKVILWQEHCNTLTEEKKHTG